MNKFFFICLFGILSFNGLNAQTNVEVNNLDIKVELNETVKVLKETKEAVAAKKKDILSAKIELTINGKLDLFLLKERRVIC